MKNKIQILTHSLAVVLVVAGSLTNVACGKKDGGSVAAVSPAASPLGACSAGACAGVTNPALLASAAATASQNGVTVDFALDIYGETSRFNAADPKSVIYYSGPAAMAGILRIQATGPSLCGATAGEYIMQASAQGNMQSATLTNARMASAPGPLGNRIEATVSQAVLYNGTDPQGTNRNSASNRMYMTVRLDTVNGQPCGVTITTY